MTEHNYKDGERDGLWTEWDEDGRQVKVGIFEDGEVGSHILGDGKYYKD